jgi:ABC-type nickel/cobalt efflux system permease component RcnA
MKWKASDILRLRVQISVMMVFGTGGMIVPAQTAADGARWAFDILAALLILLIFFWLLVQEESLKQGD